MASLLSLSDIQKTFGDAVALRSLSIDVREGEFLTLVGPSGSGKSTLLSIIAGFARPDRGSIRLRGADITARPPEERRFGVVPQGYGLFPHLTVHENVAFALRIRRKPKAEIERAVREMLELTRIETLGARFPHMLSGGEQQRVALARALIFDPEILLLDEPMSALDAALRHDLHQELVRLHREVGKTFILVTHDQQEALALSDRVAVLRDGRIEQVGFPRGLYSQPLTEFVARFLGKNNLLDGSIERQGGHPAFRWRRLALPLRPDVAANRSGAATLSIRPERIRLSAADESVSTLAGAWTGTVLRQTFFGAAVETLVDVEGQSLTVAGDARDAQLTPDQRVILTFDPEGFWFLPSGEDAAPQPIAEQTPTRGLLREAAR